jgi:hypothetical protein
VQLPGGCWYQRSVLPKTLMKKTDVSVRRPSVCCSATPTRIYFMMNQTGRRELSCVTESSVVVTANTVTDSSQNSKRFGTVTFNLHGFNNSRPRSYVTDLCIKPDIFIIALQEQWLVLSNVHTLSNVHPDFAGYGISSI